MVLMAELHIVQHSGCRSHCQWISRILSWIHWQPGYSSSLPGATTKRAEKDENIPTVQGYPHYASIIGNT